jgi:hypothetical protein
LEFICPDRTATVRAANVRATLDAFKLTPSMGRHLMERHQLKLDDLRPDNLVLVQRWLDALLEIQNQVGSNVLRQVGAHIIENADFPPNFPDIPSILLALDEIYHLNHRGEVGHYRVSKGSGGKIVVRCETPYPRQFERGLIEGICRHRRGAGRRFVVDYADGPAGGDLTCTLTVSPA